MAASGPVGGHVERGDGGGGGGVQVAQGGPGGHVSTPVAGSRGRGHTLRYGPFESGQVGVGLGQLLAATAVSRMVSPRAGWAVHQVRGSVGSIVGGGGVGAPSRTRAMDGSPAAVAASARASQVVKPYRGDGATGGHDPGLGAGPGQLGREHLPSSTPAPAAESWAQGFVD